MSAKLRSRILWSCSSKTGYYMENIYWYKSSIKTRILQAFSSPAGLLVIYVSVLKCVHVCSGKTICSACWSTWAPDCKLWRGPCGYSCPPVHEDVHGAKAGTPRSWGVSGCAGIQHGAHDGRVRS